MDVLTSMGIFRRVAEAESFSAVARENNMSQSTVSKYVAALEERLGTKLFVRSTRQLKLTESGSEYYDYCARILDDLSEAEMNVGRGRSFPTGTLRISSTATFGRLFILPFLWDFLTKYPDLNIDMILEDRYVDLVKEGVDMAIRVGPLADSSMIARKLGVSERVIVASPEYLKVNGEPETLADLNNHDCLIYSLQPSPHEWEFNSALGIEKIRIAGRFSATNPEAIGEAAMAGMGIAVVMLWSARDYIEQGRLQIILNDYKPTPLEVHAMYPERRFTPKKVRMLIDHLRSSYEIHYPLVSTI